MVVVYDYSLQATVGYSYDYVRTEITHEVGESGLDCSRM